MSRDVRKHNRIFSDGRTASAIHRNMRRDYHGHSIIGCHSCHRHSGFDRTVSETQRRRAGDRVPSVPHRTGRQHYRYHFNGPIEGAPNKQFILSKIGSRLRRHVAGRTPRRIHLRDRAMKPRGSGGSWMTRRSKPVYKEGGCPTRISSDRTPYAMAHPALVWSFVLLMIGQTASQNDAVIPWSSMQMNDSYTCDFGILNGASGSSFCYFPESPEPIMARSDGLFLVRGGVVQGRRSGVWPNGTVVVTPNPFLARRPCIMCQWYEKGGRSQTCLACRGMTVKRARYSDERYVATLMDTGVEIAASKQYFLCRFRLPQNSTDGQTAWLSDRCSTRSRNRNSSTNPMDVCTVSPSYIPLRRTGSYVVMRARIRTGDTCRICMIRVNGELTVGRACLDARMTTLLRDVRIGRLLVTGIWTTALLVVIVSIARFIYNTGVIQRFFKRITMVRIYRLWLAAVMSFWLTTASCAVTISVPDAGRPDIIRQEDVIHIGVALCFGTPIANREKTLNLLRR